MRIEYFSYFLDNNTPLYGGSKSIKITSKSKITLGDSSNTLQLSFPNHIGTHIDFPLHFIENGRSCEDYRPDFWIFNNPYLIEKIVKEDTLISLSEDEIKEIPNETDFLIIKTGFFNYRNTNQYWKNNPGLSKELFFQIKTNFPKIRVVGGDYISVSSYQNRSEGREVHKLFLGDDHPILLVEDMDLSIANKSPSKIICLPTLIMHADGSPVNIIAFYDE